MKTSLGTPVITETSDDYCVIDGVTYPRVFLAALHGTSDVLLSGNGRSWICQIGTSVAGSKPTSQAALLTALKGACGNVSDFMRLAEAKSDDDYNVTVTSGVVSLTADV